MTDLSRDSLLLFLRLLEGTASTYARSALVDFYGRKGEELIAARLLVPVGTSRLQTVDDEDGYPYAVTFDPGRDEMGYHDQRRGWVGVDAAAFRLYRPDLRALIARLFPDTFRAGHTGVVELVSDMVWEVGLVRILKKELTSLWFARRLHDHRAATALSDAICHRPSHSVRLVLTSTPASDLVAPPISLTRIVSVADLLSVSTPDTIDVPTMRLRFQGSQRSLTSDPVELSEDAQTLTINGVEVIRLQGANQVAIIRMIVAGYSTGKRLVASEVLESVGSSARTFKQAFGPKWEKLAPFMRNESGVWWLEP